MDIDDLPIHGEWVIGSLAAVTIRLLLCLSAVGIILLVFLASRGRPKRSR